MMVLAGGLLAQQRVAMRLPPVIVSSQSQPTSTGSPYVVRLPPVGAERAGGEISRVTARNPESGGLRLPAIDTWPPVEGTTTPSQPAPPTFIPRSFSPWWQAAVLQPVNDSRGAMVIDVNSLIVDALRYSVAVRAISDNAVIAETAITWSDAAFDVHTFMESNFVRTSIPTGSTLEAGFNVPRLREKDWNYSAGLRRKNRSGGRFEVAQRIGTRDSNSQFFFPENQGNSRLTMSYNQPLLNGAGQAYNASLIVLADLDTRIATDRTTAELQDHLLQVTESAWQLYLFRSALIQKQRHLERAQVILTHLEKRRELDALDSQIARARAAVALRHTELIRAATEIRNSEARLRALVNSPDMLANQAAEFVPTQAPLREFVPLELQGALITALENRPEIDAATQEIDAARIRLDVAKNELMPLLDLVLETYVSGLQGNYHVGRSWIDQFSLAEPSYTAGLQFEVPINRRAALANHTRRQAELRQLSNRFQATVATLHSEVEVAVREVETAYREMQAKYQSMLAADTDVQYLQRRWEALPGDDRAASFLLADLLDAQDRLVLEEYGFAEVQVEYTVSLTRLNRATGTLLKSEQIERVHSTEDGVPAIQFMKSEITTETLPPAARD